ncbi:hypothetical protein IW262DRAFT_1299236 [Armillaria fumosa]|nr:hypothetical protein IW262DRAFT_1299236 [Armillaria fumosa]
MEINQRIWAIRNENANWNPLNVYYLVIMNETSSQVLPKRYQLHYGRQFQRVFGKHCCGSAINAIEDYRLPSTVAPQTYEKFVAAKHKVVPPSLSGKTVVIIGENIGLGFEASKHFARMNPEWLACRCEEKEKEALLFPQIIGIDLSRRSRIVVVAGDVHHRTTSERELPNVFVQLSSKEYGMRGPLSMYLEVNTKREAFMMEGSRQL